MAEQKIALVTGGNSGIGLEVVKQLLEKGYFVYIGTRSYENGEKAIKENNLKSGSVKVIELDVINVKSIEKAATQIKKLDILINNAGNGFLTDVDGGGISKQNASTVDMDILRKAFEINFFGVVEVCKAFIPHLKDSSSPVIVNVSTDMASTTTQAKPEAHLHTVAYNTSKAAMNAYTVALAQSLGYASKFKVNAVTPGFTLTKLNANGFGKGAASGGKSPSDGAVIITHFATINSNGPTGKFFGFNSNQSGSNEKFIELPW